MSGDVDQQIKPGLWTLSDLCSFLNLSEAGARGMLKRREIPADCIVRLGKRRLRFIPDRIRTWLQLDEQDDTSPAVEKSP